MGNGLNKYKNILFPYVKFSFKNPISDNNIILINALLKKIIYYGICVDGIDDDISNIPKNEPTMKTLYSRIKRMTPFEIFESNNSAIIITDEDKICNDDYVLNINDSYIIERLDLIFRNKYCLQRNESFDEKREFVTYFGNILKYSAKIVLFDSQYLKQITLKNKDRSHLKYYREGLNLLLETYYNVSDISDKEVEIILQRSNINNNNNKKYLLKKLTNEKNQIIKHDINLKYKIYHKIPHHRYWLFYLYSKDPIKPGNTTPYGIITDFGLTDFTQYREFKSEFYHVETDDYSKDLGAPILTV